MKQTIYSTRKEDKIELKIRNRRIKKIISYFLYDPVLSVAMVAAGISALYVPPSKEYVEYIDFRVLSLLLSLMLVVAGLQKVGVFGYLIENLLKRVHNTRALAVVLVGVCFFSSMLITNDVALITFVPLGIMMLNRLEKHHLLIPIIALQTVAANLGSMLTPLGNPQNLYLYSLFNLTVIQFLRIMVIPTIISFLMLSVALFLIKQEIIESPIANSTDNVHIKKVIPWILLFILCLLSVLHVIPYGITLIIVIVGVAYIDRKILFHVDYNLLITFTFLFIFIGNIKSIPAVSTALSELVSGRELSTGILLSQVISNVPAAMLLSKFTTDYTTLIIGVNLGGLGTLIASMASLISYKLYAATSVAKTGKYMTVFTAINLLFLGVLWAVMALL
jgi:Na+/H+ antiporter NhaD/arsenite permease-like protein